MRRQITRLVAWTTTAIVVSFVIPLCLLVQTLAQDRVMATADQEARSIAIIVSTLTDDPRLGVLVEDASARTPASTTVLLPDAAMLGQQVPVLDSDPEIKRARQGESFSVTDAAGGRVLVPVSTETGLAVVLTSVTPEQLREGVVPAWALILGMGVVLVMIAQFAAWQFGRRISAPLRAVAATAHELRGGDLSARASVSGPEETVELASALNGLADRIGVLLAAERAAVGDLAHRLRTPVTALRLEAESVSDAEVAEALQGHLAKLIHAIDTLVMEARRPLREDLSAGCDATAMLEDRVAFWAVLAEDQERAFDVDLPGRSVEVRLGELDVNDVVDILIDNVFAHTPDGVGLAVSLAIEGTTAVLTVADTGPGFPLGPEADRRTGSTGLGLDIVRRTVEAVGGWVVTSGPGLPGASVEVHIPLAE